ncbi:MAG TPA: MFS transporter [Pirellulaceae bacterium]|nr:MFS transporter [Pirellulaceae bacterium]HMO94086.1 MFS transporter [Pirellulaceae bacterium]HMP71159.1 MFS transporter [Pirellulaceae bacterium]
MSDKATSRKILPVILLTVFLDLVGFSIIFPLFPDMLEHYFAKEMEGSFFHQFIATLERLSGATGSHARLAATVLFGGILGSIYSFLQFLAAPIWGALSDRIGRRRVLIVTVSGTVVSYLLWFVADIFWLLIASRMLGGAMAGNLSVASAAIADVTDTKSRAKGMGLIGAAFGLGFVLGPAIGAFLSTIDLTSLIGFIPGINRFSAAALGAGCLAIANLWLVIRIFPETLAVHENPTHTQRRPINPLATLRPSQIPGVDRVNLAYFIFISAFAGMEFTITFLAKDRFNYDSLANGKLFLFIGLIVVLVQGGVVRKVVPRFGEKRVAITGFLLALPGMLLLSASNTELMLYGSLLLLSVGSSLVTPTLTTLVSLYTPDQQQGASLGIFRSLGSLARAVAPISFAFVYWKYGSEVPYLACGAFVFASLIIALRFRNPDK